MKIWMIAAGAVSMLAAGSANAVPVNPISYDMPNGNSGSYHYWDESYGGVGATGNPGIDGSPLAGGLGDLTDGVIAPDNWFVTESPISAPGPYVGWLNSNPVITFHFTGTPTINTVRIHFDDSDGNGGVSAPASVIIDGTNYTIAEPVGIAPFWFEATGLSIAKSSFDIELVRKNYWVFASEVEFASDVPLPAPAALLGGAMVAAGFAAGRRKRK